MSAAQFQRQFGLSRYDTAFGLLLKLLAAMVRPNQDRIGGRPGQHVEIDETWIGGRTRGEGRGVHYKVLVACAVEVRNRKIGTAQALRKSERYGGRIRLAVVSDRSANQLGRFVGSVVTPGARVVTGYAGLRERDYDHHAIASILKTWLSSTHHGVSPQHLQAYLNDFTFRFNSRFYPFNAFRSLLGIAGEVSSPTLNELYSGDWQHPTYCAPINRFQSCKNPGHEPKPKFTRAIAGSRAR